MIMNCFNFGERVSDVFQSVDWTGAQGGEGRGAAHSERSVYGQGTGSAQECRAFNMHLRLQEGTEWFQSLHVHRAFLGHVCVHSGSLQMKGWLTPSVGFQLSGDLASGLHPHL